MLKLVQDCVKNWSKHVAQEIWTSFQRNFSVIFDVCFEKPSSFCWENDILKIELGPVFSTKRAYLGPVFNSTAYMYHWGHNYSQLSFSGHQLGLQLQ